MSYPPPIYHGDSGEVSAHVVRAGIEPAVVYPNGNKVFYLAQGTETAGHLRSLPLGVRRARERSRRPLPPHDHRVVLRARGHRHDLRRHGLGEVHAGDFAHVPAGGIHGFRNEDGAAKMLLHFAPGAPREAYFEGLAAGIGDFDEDAYARFMREHDNHWV